MQAAAREQAQGAREGTPGQAQRAMDQTDLAEADRTLIDKLPFLQLVPPVVKGLVAESFVRLHLPFGTAIVREGDPADAYYVLAAGRARVLKRGEDGAEIPLDVLRPGDTFGEIGLLERAHRTATVRASTDVEVLRLDRSLFEALLQRHPEIRAGLELQSRHRHLHNFLRQFTPFARLSSERLHAMFAELEPLRVPAGMLVIRQGDEPGPMYIVEAGRLRVYVEEGGTRRYLSYLRKGDFFGELSILKSERRAATVESVSACSLLALTPETFRRLIDDDAGFKAAIAERVSQYDYERVARVPLDFAEEILPADASREPVGPQQVEQADEDAAARLGPFASEDGRFVKRARRIRRFPYVRQIDETDCGAACLAMICRHFGRAVSLARIRQLVHTSVDGTSLRGICLAAEELGLAARSVKASARNLLEMPLPAILHWEGNHWVVLYGVDAKEARIADPASGPVRVPRDEFDGKWTGYAALFDYTDRFEHAPEGRSSSDWLWPFFKPFAGVLAQVLALAMIVSTLQMALPVFTQIIVDRVVVDRDVTLLNVLVIGMLAVLAFSTLGMMLQRYLFSFVAVRVDAAMLDFLTRRLLSLPMAYFASRRTGDIQRRIAGLRQIREFIVHNLVSGLTALVQLAAAIVLMFMYDAKLAAVFLVTAPAYAILMSVSYRILRPVFNRLEAAYGTYQSYQIDAIRGIEAVKAMGAEGAFRQIMLDEFHAIARRVFAADFTMMSYESGVGVVSFLSMVLFLWVGAHEVINGAMTIGALVAFNSLIALANAPISVLLSQWDSGQLISVLLDRLNDVFEQEPEQGRDRSHLVPVRTLEGTVALRNVGFRYGGPDAAAILQGITLDVPAGKRVAIVGRSGSGKTTLAKCLAGLLEPTEGSILYDGLELKTLNYRDLRRQIGFVLQENHLFNNTIAGNIAFGEPEPDMDRVIWAARLANAHDFVERLPLGSQTKIGESGLALSGGQRQRIAIARALYTQPAVLIFDEATSSLDTESERAIQENLGRVLEGRTSFVIAHRLSTVRDADLIVVLEKGSVTERGTHEELMDRRGLYYYLCSQQLAL
jgi:HlyB family type I secretion system ABC transporter